MKKKSGGGPENESQSYCQRMGKWIEVPLCPGLSLIIKSLSIQKNIPNILKNSLLNTVVSQGGEGPSFPHSLNPSESSDGTKTSCPTRVTIQDFYQMICPWYQSPFKHYLIYILAIKLWLQKGKMTFWHRMAMIFFRLQRKLVKINFFFLETAKPVLFAYAIKNN